MMRTIFLAILFLTTLATKAELVKKGTQALKTINGEAILLFGDSARVYPYEPAENGWRMIMWVGYVDTANITANNRVKKGSALLGMMDFEPHTTTLTDFALPYLDDDFAGNYKHLKKFALYLYIPDTCIVPETRMERRFEAIAKAKKKKQWKMFEQFKTDFGFVKAGLVHPYAMYFVFDERSPLGRNDFRMMVFTDTAQRIVAVANDGYRKMKLNEEFSGPLDRTCTIFYLIKLPEEERNRIQAAFIEAYRFRD
jgi:hypothetical protein